MTQRLKMVHIRPNAPEYAMIHAALVNLIIESHDDSDLTLRMESVFGNHAFDRGFENIRTVDLFDQIAEFADDEEEGWGPIKDFLGTVLEFEEMPVQSLQARMMQGMRRAVQPRGT